MVKIRLIFIKQFAFRRKGRNKQVTCRKEIDQKNILTDLFVWNKMVQSSLKWLLGSSRRYKRLTWRSQGQMHLRLPFCSKLQKNKKFHNTHTVTWRILRYKSITDKVSLKLHKASSKTFCLGTVNFFFYSPSNEMLTVLANSHRPFIIVQWFLACQTNNLNGCFLILTTLPVDCYSYDPIVHVAKS